MNGESFLFTVFALATCLSAVAVVFSQTVVRMAFWLIIALGSTSALFFLANADFVGAAQLRLAADQRGVNVDFAHVVDDHRHAQPLAVVEDVVEQGGFPRAEKTGKNGDGQAGIIGL